MFQHITVISFYNGDRKQEVRCIVGTVVLTATLPVLNSAILFKTALSTLATSQVISNISLPLNSAQLSSFVLLMSRSVPRPSCFCSHVVFFQTGLPHPSSLSPIALLECVSGRGLQVPATAERDT